MAMDMESIKKELFRSAMKGKWKQVVEMYRNHPTIQKEKITRSGDTALHIAVSDGNEEVVAQMVDSLLNLSPKDREEALKTHNHRKNTALHLAAAMGNAKMCRIIASLEPLLVDCRNVDGETPLFLASIYGRKQAFLWLHYIRNNSESNSSPNYANCRRNYGDTILHCAIAGDYFDLAFQIIYLYKDLVTWVNEEGLSPLHLLASKPSAFRSGSRLGRAETIIYHCVFVEDLKVTDPLRFQTAFDKTSQKPNDEQLYPTAPFNNIRSSAHEHDYPDNYQICCHIFRALKTTVTAAINILGEFFSKNKSVKEDKADANAKDMELAGSGVVGSNQLFPANYRTLSDLVRFLYLVLLVFLGLGSDELKKIHRKKEKHTWAVQVMKELLYRGSSYEYEDNGRQPQFSNFLAVESPTLGETKPFMHKSRRHPAVKESPILIAAKNGVMEIIEEIVDLFPVSIHDLNEEKKNIVLLAVEHRQPHVYQFSLKKNIFKESLFRQVDNMGNSALHLAAMLGDHNPWLIPGEALQMQWEIKWYQFVKRPMPLDFFARYNRKFETPEDIFNKTHKELVRSGGQWLNKTSESCSVVAALIATVAFATAATVPGGMDETSGEPVLEKQPAFTVFAMSSLVALCFSVTAVVMFLSILTSRFQEFDFGKALPMKLLLGLTSLFMSIASILVSFCAGHFFVLKDQLQYAALPIYLVTCLPVTLFALAQFPLYLDLLWASFKQVPQPSYRATPVTSDHVWRLGYEDHDAKPDDHRPYHPKSPSTNSFTSPN
ncbi:serine/threonine-protein phosphatase 6 regulatory ankyrin repeat subunit B isoform X2 [Senna tora]|uniref:Serine/threonine-protein phosphatase 6 regulatory ankyrin repeat subunit B isoform X2 n=1 Tax=Senna tora TaxID=362788 RepID=A0A834WIJ5_9FABA|nr:serine/threonine-protein phosphatase 6 regulatory ankyrin repeat subunit B isoform X2 [Senna tora]